MCSCLTFAPFVRSYPIYAIKQFRYPLVIEVKITNTIFKICHFVLKIHTNEQHNKDCINKVISGFISALQYYVILVVGSQNINFLFLCLTETSAGIVLGFVTRSNR